MIIENKNIEKICNFYVSDFHLEMILLPYLNQKLKEEEPVTIISEKNLNQSIKELISKVNLDNKIKNNILNLKWDSAEIKEIQNNSNVVLIGTENFIEQKKNKLIDMDVENLKIIDCYNLQEVEKDVQKIVLTHDKNLNTLGITNV